MRITALKQVLSVIAVSAVTMLGAGPATAVNPVGCTGPVNTIFHLDNDGVNFTLNPIAPGPGSAKFLDSPVLKRTSANPYIEIEEWEDGYVGFTVAECALDSFSPLHVWLGLRNSDDQGTNFDLKADVYFKSYLPGSSAVLVSTAEQLCIKGLTRNPALAQEVIMSLPVASYVVGDGEFSLKLSARIGSPACGGHASATGLRVYYDSADRDSRFDVTFGPDI